MKQYVWKMDVWECYCRYSVVAESLEEAREIAVYDLTKDKKKLCATCLLPEISNRFNLFTKEGEKEHEWYYNKGTYVIRNWIRDTEPDIHEIKKLIRG